MGTRRRVKLYVLNEEGQWDDRGTGHISCQYNQDTQGFGLYLRSENDSETLLEHRISMDSIYQHQNETIITWTDPDTDADYALSFQENEGCNDMWEQILSVQGRQSGDDQQLNARADHEMGRDESAHFPELELPKVLPENLTRIAEVINECATGPPPWREQLSAHLAAGLPMGEAGAAAASDDAEAATAAATRSDHPGRVFILDLINVYRQCEVTEDEGHMSLLYHIFKGIFFLNEPRLVEMLLSEEIAMDVMGIMENDPDLPEAQRIKHREMLRHGNGLINEVVQISDSAVRDKIRQTILLMYVKDTVLARTIEDSTLNTLSTMEYFNKVEIVSTLQADGPYLDQLFSKLGANLGTESKEAGNALHLLQELCTMAKNQQAQLRCTFYQVMIERGIFDVLERMITSEDMSLRAHCAEMLDMVVKHDPILLRRHLLAQKPQVSFFNTIVRTMVYDPVEGVQGQLAELIRTLIDVDTMNESTDEKDAFLDEFYTIFMSLVDAAWPRPKGDEVGSAASTTLLSPASGNFSKPVSKPTKTFIIELLTYCVAHHSFRIRFCVLSNHIIQRVLDQLSERNTSIVLACIRFFRTVVGTKDEFYQRYLVKNSLFKPVVNILVANGAKYNLLNSALLELFEFIRTENMKSLVQHLAENFRAEFEAITYIDTFTGLLLKYEQAQDQYVQSDGNEVSGAARGPPAHAIGGMVGAHGRGLDRSEEDYFNEDSDEEGSESSSTSVLHSLADSYGSDGEDESQNTCTTQGAAGGEVTAPQQDSSEEASARVTGDKKRPAQEGGDSAEPEKKVHKRSNE